MKWRERNYPDEFKRDMEKRKISGCREKDQ